MIHLGFGIDSSSSSFYITDKCRRKVASLRDELLARQTANLHDLQRWVGKCNHLRLVFPAVSLFTFACRQQMPLLGELRVPLPQAALDEIAFWSFVDTKTEPIPFLQQQHASVRLSSDSSGFAWGAVVELPTGPLSFRDYWTSDLLRHDICVKEALALYFCLQSLGDSLHGRRVDAFLDNEGVVLAWQGLRARSPELVGVLKMIFLFCVDMRVSLKTSWVSTNDNPADAPSRAVSGQDAMLSDRLRSLLWSELGPFSFDLMALPSNVFVTPAGQHLPFFSRQPAPGSSGTNVFAQCPPAGRLYAFPPFCVITPLIRLLLEWGAGDVVLVLPVDRRRPAPWLHLLRPFICGVLPLACAGDQDVLRFPSSDGFQSAPPSVSTGFSAYLCQFPPAVPVPAPSPLPLLRVLISGDSVLRVFSSLSWPMPFRVETVASSGARLRRVVDAAVRRSIPPFDILVIHAGVNDASKPDFSEAAFEQSCAYAEESLCGVSPVCSVLISLACVSRSPSLNKRVLSVNKLLRQLASRAHFAVVSNDNIMHGDLSDDVHLNGAGAARLFQNFLSALKAVSSASAL